MAAESNTVMILEPDVLVRMVIADHLRGCGYRVIEGTVAEDVWTILGLGVRIDIVFAEIQLSGDVDGFALAKRVRQTRPEIDVILTSGITHAAEKSSSLCEQGPIRKPYQPKDVESRIRDLIAHRGRARER
jgi:DNA-binding NtrC family response regulator